MKFEWDETKNHINIRKHGYDFADAAEMFRGGGLVAEPDIREDYKEMRWVGLGVIRGRVTHITFTERDRETIRIISLRKATSRERKAFDKTIHDRLEAY